MMDDIIEMYENLKVSAFDKVKQVNYSIHNITIGPNSSFQEHTPSKQNEKKQSKKIICKPPVQAKQPVTEVKRILMVREMQRIEEVQHAIINRQKKIANQQQQQDTRLREEWLRTRRILLHRVEQEELQILQALEEHDKNSNIRNEQRLQFYQELENRRRKKDQEIQAKEQMRRDLISYIDKIMKNQKDIGLVYQEILNIVKFNSINESLKEPIGEINQELKSVIFGIDEIIKKCGIDESTKMCKSNVGPSEVKKSYDLLQHILLLKDKVQVIINDFNRKQTDNLKRQQVEENREPPKSNNTVAVSEITPTDTPIEKVTTNIDKFVSKLSLRYYSELQTFLQNHEKSFEELFRDDSLKQFKFDCKKAVNIPVNAISAVNPQHLLDKYDKLANLLSGKAVFIGDSAICATRHPQGIAFCMDLLAKKFILQGDLMISSNLEAAFCYATIILSLWNDFPDFGKLLLAHLHKQCPYLVPIYLPRTVGQTSEEYYTSLGYQYNNGSVEKQDKFLKRMTGIMRLYSAIIISTPKKSQTCDHPHGLSQGWRWLTAMLNLEPRTDITATLLHVFLETVGWTMQQAYRKEFHKIVLFIMNVYMPMLKTVDTGGPYTRLEVLLQDYKQNGHFSKPNGMLSTSYW